MPLSEPTTSPRAPASRGSVVISVDAMGGDRGPAAVVAGIEKSAEKNPDIRFIVHGPEPELRRLIGRRKGLAERCDIRHAGGVVTMHDKPSQVIRSAQDTSMWSAIESVKTGEAGAAVSCGNTGALMAMAKLALRTMPGIDRPALAALLPTLGDNDVIMLDLGANTEVDSRNLVQFAVMGAAYARTTLDLASPRVALLNIGTEELQGIDSVREAAATLGMPIEWCASTTRSMVPGISR